ncbi:MAG TPA: aminotransferase class V-fold PLP-dependent enzyme [Bryobacteraceae bacterium]|nr:aminotransferase class V-fold PLP-dependent enzyme [Bryobacteraceae bacterium]
MASINPLAEPQPLAARYRDEFPVTRELIYLNHAAVAPLSRRTAESMKALADDVATFGSLHYDRWMETYAGLRRAVATLIGAGPEEIAIVKNTSEGIAMVAVGLHWRPGDRVVAFQEEFPANYHPWARLLARGVEITWLSIYDPLEKIAAAVRGAKLLAISFVNYLSGYRVELQKIGELCHAHSCFFFVDAIQGLGVFPLDVNACHIDALASDGHKWLLGPEGNGILYVRRERQDAVEPVEFGWTNTEHYFDYASRDMTLRPDAGRYECGTLNTIGCFGLRTAIEFLLEIGIPNVAEAVNALAQRLESGARAKGYQLMRDRTEKTGSGIVSFRHPTIDARVIVSDLKRHKILAANRQGWVRVAPHFYLSMEDIDQVLACLPGA